MKIAANAKISSFTPNETYLSVGLALSYWEHSEDIQMGLFNLLCVKEPVARQAFLTAPRSIRVKMLREALERYPEVLSSEETIFVKDALRHLDKLASKRNQIAHGYVQEINSVVDDEVAAEGVFLMPALNEAGMPGLRDARYFLTCTEIDAFRDEVREHRWVIHEVHMAALMRNPSVFSKFPPSI
ncbi:hypothetical protein [Paracoccus tibetensis]|uniref:hypothetical protein n=1 Tax=Paracoccus tibetensis TaxID=336292 RepID=UPI0011143043|nr:hypothetical protein [Paracoccus tibetensis]